MLFTALPAAAQDQLWITQLGTSTWDYAHAVAADGSDGVYIGGGTQGSLIGSNAGGYDAWFVRYDDAGNPLWMRQFGTSANNWVRSLASDGSGGVYVAVEDSTSGNPDSAWLARYDIAGTQLWIQQIGTSSTPNSVRSVASDGSGGVYITGTYYGTVGGSSSISANAWFARYDSTGNQLWVRQLGTGATFGDCVAPDGSGGVYVGGGTRGSLAGPDLGYSDAWLARYDGAGNQLWIRQFGASTNDYTFAAAPDGSGGVYLGGETWGDFGGPVAGGSDAWLARYDSAGNELWVQQFGTGTSDDLTDAASDGSGGVYVSGTTLGSLGGPTAGSCDSWIARYNSAGDQLWIRQLGTSASEQFGTAIAAHSSGDVSIGGTTFGSLAGPNAGGRDAWLARYGGQGVVFCTASLNSTGWSSLIGASGSSSVASNDVTLSAGPGPANEPGIFYYGPNALSGITFGNGFRCVGGAAGTVVKIFPVVMADASGLMSTTLDNTDPLHAQIVPGATLHFQAWFRDPAGGGVGFDTSNGLSVTFVP